MNSTALIVIAVVAFVALLGAITTGAWLHQRALRRQLGRLRREMQAGFAEMRGEFASLRAELQALRAEVKLARRVQRAEPWRGLPSLPPENPVGKYN
jgi:hypothetical protein